MSSILTNNSAMVALQTLKSINMNLGKVQSEISTGKTIESAKDNAATWAISKVMSSDVKGFEAISDSLGLGQATVGVGLEASESITDLLTEIKGKIVNSQEDNVDRAKIQTDLEALTDQIGSISSAAQFNGLNLVSNRGFDAGSGTSSILSSLDRAADGTVTASDIDVVKQDLSTTAAVYDAAGTGTGAAAANTATAFTGADGATGAVLTLIPAEIVAGTQFRIEQINGTAIAAADQVVVSVLDGDTVASVREKLVVAMNFSADRAGIDMTFSGNATTAAQIDATNNTGAAAAVAAADTTKVTGGSDDGNTTLGGNLSLLSYFDVSTADGADAALNAIEGLIQTSINSAAALGSSAGRIEAQNDFVSNMIDGLKSGIGTLVDADMEAASARLQALQTQQQLGVQALSIANQAPQTILSLFR